MIRPEVQKQIADILGELETYLIKANQLDWIALASIVASFVISFVAICISLKTAKDQKRLLQKQNDIVLFDSRCNVFNEYETLYGHFADIIYNLNKNNINDSEMIVVEIKKVLNLRYFYSQNIKDIKKLQDDKFNALCSAIFLFNKEIGKHIHDFSALANAVIYVAYNFSVVEGEKAFYDSFFASRPTIAGENIFTQLKAEIKGIEDNNIVNSIKKSINETINKKKQ